MKMVTKLSIPDLEISNSLMNKTLENASEIFRQDTINGSISDLFTSYLPCDYKVWG